MDLPLLRLGTCSWTAKGWLGTVYPKGMKQTDFLHHYGQRWNSVEIDSSFYATPPRESLERWYDLTPADFLFAAKAPQIITHEKFLENCFADIEHFLHSMRHLREKLGPILFQFPYYAQRENVSLTGFLDRLQPVLEFLPTQEMDFAVEVRNKTWLTPPLLDLLRQHNVTLAHIDHPWMPTPTALYKVAGIQTGRFAYIRCLGDRHGIEKITKTWDKQVIDRRADILRWVPKIREMLAANVKVHVYVNNHYSGYAPADTEVLRDAILQAELG
jgi:uncharacterized protein YecE (DUF72 family)